MKRILKMVRWIGAVMAVVLMACLGLALLDGIYFAAVGCAAVLLCLGLLMANEITYAANLQVAKNGASASASGSLTATMAGTSIFENVQSITNASTTQITLPATVGYIYLKNLDATNYVEVGLNTPLTQKFLKLRPGEIFVGPVSVATIYGLANTAPVLLQVLATDL